MERPKSPDLIADQVASRSFELVDDPDERSEDIEDPDYYRIRDAMTDAILEALDEFGLVGLWRPEGVACLLSHTSGQVCTRREGHEGPHAAANSAGLVTARWEE